MTFPYTLDHWRRAVAAYFTIYCGLAFDDIEVSDRELSIWFECGVPARIVGGALTTRAPRIKYTLTDRAYDQRPIRYHQNRIAVRMRARGML